MAVFNETVSTIFVDGYLSASSAGKKCCIGPMPAWSNYGPAEQFCTSLVDRKQRQPCITRQGELMEEMEESLGLRPIPSEDLFFFFLENSITFGTKICVFSRLRPANSNNFEK